MYRSVVTRYNGYWGLVEHHISVVSNIAEGSGRRNERDHLRFLRMARGSVCEVECQLLLCRDVGYLDPAMWRTLDGHCREVGKMLNGLIR